MVCTSGFMCVSLKVCVCTATCLKVHACECSHASHVKQSQQDRETPEEFIHFLCLHFYIREMGGAIFSLLHLIFNANTYNKLSPWANYDNFVVKKQKYTFLRMPTGLSFLLLMRSHLHILMYVWNSSTGKFANCAHILYRIISFPLILKSVADCLTYCFIEHTGYI